MPIKNHHANDSMKLRVMHAFGKGALYALCQLACRRTQWNEASNAPFAGFLDMSGVEDVLLYMTLVRDTFRCIRYGDWTAGRAQPVPQELLDVLAQRATHHSREDVGDLSQYFSLAHRDALDVAITNTSASDGALESQKLRMTAEFLEVFLRRVDDFADACHEYDEGIIHQDLHDFVACVEVGADMLDALNSESWDADEPVPASVLLDLGRCLRDRRFQLSSRNIVEDIVVDSFETVAKLASEEVVVAAIRGENSHPIQGHMAQPQLSVAPADDPTSVIGRVRHLVAEGELLRLVRSWFDAIVDDEREAINAAGLTLEEVYSVTREGNLGHPTKCITIDMCGSEWNVPMQVTGTTSFASFQRKAMGLTRVQRAGVALALQELVRSGSTADQDAILTKFRLHGIRLAKAH